MSVIAASLAVITVGYCAVKGLLTVLWNRNQVHRYPPGPPRRPLFGALTSFPKDKIVPTQRFGEWANLYGDIVYAPLPGMNLIILNTYELAQEVLSKRPANTAFRKSPYLLRKLMGYSWMLLFMEPGVSHSKQRKMIRRGIGPQRIKNYDPFIESEIAKLMMDLKTVQGDPNLTIRDAIGRLVIRATYGEKIWEEMGENLGHWNIEGTELVNEAMFGIWAVNFLPALRFIPNWVPGLRFKEIGRSAPIGSNNIRFSAYTRALQLYKEGTLDNCILDDLLEEFGDNEDVRDSTSTLYFAAFETVGSFCHAQNNAITHHYSTHIFFVSCDAQRMFEEIQAATHGERLPTVADRPNLPFAESALKEAIRQNPFISLGVVHVNEKEEIVRGYHIPKETMIHQNNQFMLNDPRVWGDPEVFRPERFLEADASEKPNPLTLLFGHGSRVCPGMYFADRVVMHVVATIVSLFHITPLEGKRIPDPQSVEYTDRAIRHPIGFECRFIPRNEKALHLLKAISLVD